MYAMPYSSVRIFRVKTLLCIPEKSKKRFTKHDIDYLFSFGVICSLPSSCKANVSMIFSNAAELASVYKSHVSFQKLLHLKNDTKIIQNKLNSDYKQRRE